MSGIEDSGNQLCGHEIALHNLNDETVSAVHRCNTEAASKLCIFDLNNKLNCNGRYDIGCTYLNEDADFWFYYTTTSCPKQVYLLNLFVRCKSPRNFSLGISDTVNINVSDVSGKSMKLSGKLKWFSFRCVDISENHYIKTFCFSKKNTKDLQSLMLLIPIKIQNEIGLILSEDIVKSIKLQHDLGALISKQADTDIVLKSAEGTKFSAHKAILAAHSSVLRSLIKEGDNTLFIDISNADIDLLLEFVYKGTIKNIKKHDCTHLMEIARKFKIDTLFLLAQHMIGDQIDVDNAIEIAIIAKKFQLDELLYKVTMFIKNHPEIIKTTGWLELKDVELMKYFFEHLNYGKD